MTVQLRVIEANLGKSYPIVRVSFDLSFISADIKDKKQVATLKFLSFMVIG